MSNLRERVRAEGHMEGYLSTSCPCLRSLWERMFKSEKGNDGLEREDSNFKPGRDPNSEERYKTTPNPYKLTQPVASKESAVYMALWAFEARDTDELSFNAGDRFCVMKRAGDWWTANKLDASGRVLGTGVVPHSYLERAESVGPQP